MRKQINCTSVIGTMIVPRAEVFLFLKKRREEQLHAKKKSNTDISISASAP